MNLFNYSSTLINHTNFEFFMAHLPIASDVKLRPLSGYFKKNLELNIKSSDAVLKN